jgi:hypothetical protein
MSRIETILGKAVFDFVFSPAIFFKLVFLGRAVFFTTLEIIRPSRTLSYLPVIGRDLVAYGFFRCTVLPIVLYLNNIIPGNHAVPASLAHLPLAVRVAL